MDNIKFAIEYLKNNSHKMIEENNNYAIQASNMAIQALEKQIPKKLIRHMRLPDKKHSYLCPTCNRLYWDKVFISECCDSCGQIFDVEEL